MDSIVVKINSILCQKDNFIIASADCDNIPLEYDEFMDGTTRIIGYGDLSKSTKYKLTGNWKKHTTYGWQFAFEQIEVYVPESTDYFGIECYLSSGLFKGIGPKMAQYIVEHFKEETLNVLTNEPERLIEVKGISKKKIQGIVLFYINAKKYETLSVLLSPYGITNNKIAKIIEKYGDKAEETIKQNPYCLCKEIDGFGFLSADKFALAVGIDNKSIDRIKEGIKYCLKQAANMSGHVYLTETMLGKRLSTLLNSNVYDVARNKFEKSFLHKYEERNSADKEKLQELAISYAIKDEDVIKALSELSENDEIKIEYSVVARMNGGDIFSYTNETLEKVNFYEKETKIDIISPQTMLILNNGKEEEFYETKDNHYIFKSQFGTIKRDIYLKNLWFAEYLSAKDLNRLMNHVGFKPINGSLSSVMENMENKYKVSYAKKQKDAILSVLKHNVLVMTGGPGTGKTTTIKGILGLYSHFFPNDVIALAAPTGRAAKRMSEATGLEAITAHRLLEYGFNGFERNRENPLECDLLILDEISMIDIELFSAILKAIPDNCKLVLVGDANQLPSVGPGCVLNDLIQSGKVPFICLNEIFRQKGTSLIVVNADKINNSNKDLEYGSDFQVIYEDIENTEEMIVKDIVNTYNKEIKKYGIENVQVLVPFRRKSAISVESLNKVLEPIANTQKTSSLSVEKGNSIFKEKDRVMQMTNDYNKGIFNGDIGTVISIQKELYSSEKDAILIVDFDGNKVQYSYDELDDLVLAYATTIHKSQGSEYDSIIMPILQSQSFFLCKNIFYTGITRAKKHVTLIANARAIQIAISQNDKTVRKSKLSSKI